MITIDNGGGGVFALKFIEGETIGQMIQRLLDTEKMHLKTAYTVQETQTGRVLGNNEIIVDDRLYRFNAWLAKA